MHHNRSIYRSTILFLPTLVALLTLGLTNCSTRSSTPLSLQMSNAALLDTFLQNSQTKTLGLDIRNISGTPEMSTALRKPLERVLVSKGYTLTRRLDDANYQIIVKILHIGNLTKTQGQAALRLGAHKSVPLLVSNVPKVSEQTTPTAQHLTLVADIHVLQKMGNTLVSEKSPTKGAACGIKEVSTVARTAWRQHHTRVVLMDENQSHHTAFFSNHASLFAQRLVRLITGMF